MKRHLPIPVRYFGNCPGAGKVYHYTREIKIRASVVWQGKQTPVPAELIISTFPSEHTLIADKEELAQAQSTDGRNNEKAITVSSDCEKRVLDLQQELSRLKLKEVEKQQSDFE